MTPHAYRRNSCTLAPLVVLVIALVVIACTKEKPLSTEPLPGDIKSREWAKKLVYPDHYNDSIVNN